MGERVTSKPKERDGVQNAKVPSIPLLSQLQPSHHTTTNSDNSNNDEDNDDDDDDHRIPK